MAKTCKECGRSVDQLWSRGRCYFCSNKAYGNTKKKNGSPTTYRKPSDKTRLDIAFGEYIKKKNMTTEGRVYCFTSLRPMTWDQIEAGHFIARGCMRFRWDEYNVWPQSKSDNRWGDGQLDIYRQHLVQLYGDDFITAMEAQTLETRRYYPAEIKELLQYYEKQIRELKHDPVLGTLIDEGLVLWRDASNRYVVLNNNKLKLIS